MSGEELTPSTPGNPEEVKPEEVKLESTPSISGDETRKGELTPSTSDNPEGDSSYLNLKMLLYIVVFLVVTVIVLSIIRYLFGYNLTDNCNPENKFDIQKNCGSKVLYFSSIYGISIIIGLVCAFLTYYFGVF